MTKSFIPYSTQSIGADDIRVVNKVLQSGWITQGPKVKEFETDFAGYAEAKYAVAVSNATAGLHIACLALGLKSGDEVIVPTLSFTASASCIIHCDAKPVFVDVYQDTLTINVEQAEKKISKYTKAIIAVDFAGHPAEWSKLKRIANKHKLKLIDDAAHSFGSIYKNRKIGSIADITIFSFHPVKTITTGEGGMLTTNNKEYFEKISLLRNHGIIKSRELHDKYGGWFYDIKNVGFNFRLTDIQAALGISQLKKAETFIKKRRNKWNKYKEALSKFPQLILPIEKKDSISGWHLFPIRIDSSQTKISRKELYQKLINAGIGVQIHFIPLHYLSFYRQFVGVNEKFPVSENYYNSALSLPLYPALTQNEQFYVIGTLKKILHE